VIRIKISSKYLFIITPIIAILLQGSYFNFQSYIVVIVFLLTILLHLYNNKCLIEKSSLLFYLIVVCGFIIPDILNKQTNNFVFESIRYSCLVLPITLSCENSKKKLLLGTYIASTFISLLGILAYVKVFPTSEWATTIDGVFRLQSTIGYANTTAVFCGIGILLGVYFRTKNKDFEFINSIMIFINCLALIFTYSKLGIFCFIVAVIIAFSIRYKQIRYSSITLTILGLIGVSTLFLLGKERILLGSTLVSRFIYWQDAFWLFSKNPLGIGVNVWEQKQYQIQSAGYFVKYVHNGLLQIALDGGIIALIGFCLIVIIGLMGIYKKYKNTKENFYLMLIAIIVFIIMHGAVDIDFCYSAILLALGIVVSYGYDGKEIVCKKYVVCSIIALIVIITPFQFIPKTTLQNIEGIIKNYQISYTKNDYDNMFIYAKEWVDFAPRQQNANDAYYLALRKMLEKTGDAKYLTELNELRKNIITLNKTANPLTKYYDSYTNIIIPK